MTSRNVTVCAATLKDIKPIWKIYQATVGEAAKRDDEYWKRLIRQGGVYIAILEETAIGFGAIDIHATEQIRYVYVIPEYQESDLRLGSKILEALEAVARQNGICLIRLHSTPNAVRFYEKAGYRALRVEDTVGHDHPGVEMEKDISANAGSLAGQT